MGALQIASAWVLAAFLVGLVEAASVACGSSCVEQGNVVLLEHLGHTSEPCTLTIAGATGTAIYDFPPWMGSDAQCMARQGPLPRTCSRSRSVSYVPIDDNNSPTGGAALQTVDAFEALFWNDPNATTARAYFGSDDVYATLTCSSVVIADHELKHFRCVTGG